VNKLNKKGIVMSQANEENIQVHVSPDLEYAYRDISNIFVGQNEVTFEFGNHHKAMPGRATISNRIVMSIADAYDFQQRLNSSLLEAQRKLQESLQQNT
jgi:hypothetical protein